jgi:pseudaminic acid biosynthesis-associated methylase
VSDQDRTTFEADRLEGLWQGDFGEAYVGRNVSQTPKRAEFWRLFLEDHPASRFLEVGCAHGENFAHLAPLVDPHDLWGLDINQAAIERAHATIPEANVVWGRARDLPFRDRYFDAVFTIGLLIHQPEATLPLVMSEIVRCSNRWVMCGEYYAAESETIDYHGQSAALFKRDYARLYSELFPQLRLVSVTELTQEEHGFDRVTWVVLERIA